MNRMVRQNYPVEKLPEDLRDGITHASVTVSLEEEAPDISPAAGHFTRWKHLRRTEFLTTDEIVDHVRALRDEWDRR